MLLENYEEPDGDGFRCPGKECDRWASAKGDTYDEKLKACSTCPKECSPPIREEDKAAVVVDDEAESLVETIAQLVDWENAGIATDWSEYPFEIQKLFVIWRDKEKQLKTLRQARLQTFIKGFYKASPPLNG